jgi:hypothetical protein
VSQVLLGGVTRSRSILGGHRGTVETLALVACVVAGVAVLLLFAGGGLVTAAGAGALVGVAYALFTPLGGRSSVAATAARAGGAGLAAPAAACTCSSPAGPPAAPAPRGWAASTSAMGTSPTPPPGGSGA